MLYIKPVEVRSGIPHGHPGHFSSFESALTPKAGLTHWRIEIQFYIQRNGNTVYFSNNVKHMFKAVIHSLAMYFTNK